MSETQEMVLDASLINTQHYKVRIKGKEQTTKRSNALPYLLVLLPYKKALGRPRLLSAQYIYIYIYIYIYDFNW